MTAPGEQIVAEIVRKTDTVLLGMSCGKDSIAAWLAIKPHFRRIVPYHMHLVPDLEFVERGIRHCEEFMGQHIIRIPHPSFHRLLNNYVFQCPSRRRTIAAAGLPNFSYADAQQGIRDQLGLGDECYTAIGVRAADSPHRLMAIRKYGAISRRKKEFFPVWDWNKARLVGAISEAGIKLPAEYRYFGRSFDGIDYRFLAPIKQHFPRDYATILEWFPLADLEIKRREFGQLD